jgi:CheB methylesterase
LDGVISKIQNKEIARSAAEAANVATGAVKMAETTNETIAKLGISSAEIGNVVKVITYDGLEGCRHIHEAGGQIIVQDEASSVVWGMPGIVANSGLADKILPLEKIAAEIIARV